MFPISLQPKRWVRKRCKQTSFSVLLKIDVMIRDTVQVIAAVTRVKAGEATCLPKHNITMIVKDLDMKSKHKKDVEDETADMCLA